MKDTWTSEDDLKGDLLSPLFEKASTIKIATGYFTVSIFEMFYDELSEFAKNGELFQLIIGSDTNPETIKILQEIYAASEQEAPELLNSSLFKDLNTINDNSVQLIYDLCSTGKLEIKIGMTEDGIYHQKTYLYANEDKCVVINGSLNLTASALLRNFEVIDVYSSKAKYDVMTEIFDKCWNDKIVNNTVKPIDEYLLTETIKEAEIRNLKLNGFLETVEEIKLRPYQEEAIEYMLDNDFTGFLEMATGTGKTFTTLYGLKKYLSDKDTNLISIIAPYKHLAEQWGNEVKKIFGKDTKVLICHSESNKWKSKVTDYIRRSRNQNVFLIYVTDSFFNSQEELISMLNKRQSILIVDEAHNLTVDNINFLEKNVDTYNCKLGLSATPKHETDEIRTERLFKYFVNESFVYGLQEAIEEGYLTKYEYNVNVVHLDIEEEKLYKELTRRIKKTTDKSELSSLLKARSQVLSTAKEKITKLVEIMKQQENLEHSLIYCAPGKNSFNENYDFTNIQQVSSAITEEMPDVTCAKITFKESIEDRKKIVESFQKREIDAILAIKCLDEGYDIPCVEKAFILKSTRNYKEYVQRRGRVLRLSEGKNMSYIFDFIVSIDGEIPYEETKRFLEYNSLAETREKNEEIMSSYELIMERDY